MGLLRDNGQREKPRQWLRLIKKQVAVINRNGFSKVTKSLKDWGKQKWRTKSGKKSSVTGERYLPSAAIKIYLHRSMLPLQKLKEKLRKRKTIF